MIGETLLRPSTAPTEAREHMRPTGSGGSLTKLRRNGWKNHEKPRKYMKNSMKITVKRFKPPNRSQMPTTGRPGSASAGSGARNQWLVGGPATAWGPPAAWPHWASAAWGLMSVILIHIHHRMIIFTII